MEFEELIKKMKDSANSYMKNEIPYKNSVEESSGFYSGVLWTLKKLNKLGLLKIDKK